LVILTALDLLGTLVFAFSGSLVAARRGLDVFGFVVLALAAGTAGGVMRDVLIGATPPVALVDWRYSGACVLAALFVFVFGTQAIRIEPAIRVLDAFGLGLFAAAGTTKSLDLGLDPIASVILGVLTAVGGGIARDLLAGLVPAVLRAEIYAIAAAIGSVAIVIAVAFGLPLAVGAPIGAATATALRLAAMRFGWQAPRPGGPRPA
jgi:uncharacterized membrane protein YeiH